MREKDNRYLYGVGVGCFLSGLLTIFYTDFKVISLVMGIVLIISMFFYPIKEESK